MKLAKAVFVFPLIVIIHLVGSAASQGRKSSSDYHHRFKSLDRIRSRLDGNGPADDPKDGGASDLTPYHSFDPLPGNALGNLSSAGVERTSSSSRSSTGRLTQSGTHQQPDFDDAADVDDDDDSYEDEDEEVLPADKPTLTRTYSSYRRHFQQPQTTTTPTTTTSTTTTTTTTPPPPSFSYSQYKWQHLGTRQSLDQYRRSSLSSGSSPSSSSSSSTSAGQQRHHGHHHHGHHYSQRAQTSMPTSALSDAINHALKVSKEGGCSVPKPRLIRIQDFYPHPGKSYLPHCTILHQCTDDTGCCRHETKTCSPKTTQRVELAFYITTYGADSSKGSTVERLVFYNHTECECRDRMDDLMPRDGSRMPTGPAPSPSASASRSQSYTAAATSEPIDPFPVSDHRRRGPQCRCSTHFAERILPDGSCACDCFDKQKECLQLKRGKDYFSMQDKWCIKTGRCEVPSCAFGSYIHLAGRCPRKKERYSPPLTWQRYMAS